MTKFGVSLQKVFQVAACCKVNLPRRGRGSKHEDGSQSFPDTLHTHTHSLMNLIARPILACWSTLSKDRTLLAIQSQTTKTCDTLFVRNSNLKRYDSHAPIFPEKSSRGFSQRRVWKKKMGRTSFVKKRVNWRRSVDGLFRMQRFNGERGWLFENSRCTSDNLARTEIYVTVRPALFIERSRPS